MIFKGVRDGRPYPDHGLEARGWAKIPPRQFRLDELTTLTTVLALDKLLSEDSTFYGDLFAHVVRWNGELYLEDGLHRAVRSALRNRHVIHARMLDLDAAPPGSEAPGLDRQLDDTDELPPTQPRTGQHESATWLGPRVDPSPHAPAQAPAPAPAPAPAARSPQSPIRGPLPPPARRGGGAHRRD